ncbi:hypothetical protein BD408DRAFT_417608 [Parasitella parasitica]|nr:hypothetical protein BD408DRAFT_417608 [Parasitella parasitica]
MLMVHYGLPKHTDRLQFLWLSQTKLPCVCRGVRNNAKLIKIVFHILMLLSSVFEMMIGSDASNVAFADENG